MHMNIMFICGAYRLAVASTADNALSLSHRVTVESHELKLHFQKALSN